MEDITNAYVENEVKSSKKFDSLKSEHLRSGEKPIMVDMGTSTEDIIKKRIEKLIKIPERGFPRFVYILKKALRGLDEEISPVVNVDFSITNKKKLYDFNTAGKYTYLISKIDDRDKFTDHLINCTSIIATGKETHSNKNISFVSHQNPKFFLGKEKNNFENDLTERLLELKERSEKETIDIVIVSGKYTNHRNYKEQYKKSVEFITLVVEKVFDFEPVVVGGPKTKGLKDAMYYDNGKRRAYLIRQQGIPLHPEFVNSTMQENTEKWEEVNE